LSQSGIFSLNGALMQVLGSISLRAIKKLYVRRVLDISLALPAGK
jgi:hypothetical protein